MYVGALRHLLTYSLAHLFTYLAYAESLYLTKLHMSATVNCLPRFCTAGLASNFVRSACFSRCAFLLFRRQNRLSHLANAFQQPPRRFIVADEFEAPPALALDRPRRPVRRPQRRRRSGDESRGNVGEAGDIRRGGWTAKRAGWGSLDHHRREGSFRPPHPGLRPTLPIKGREGRTITAPSSRRAPAGFPPPSGCR